MNTLERLLLAIILIEIPVQMDIYLDYQQSAAELGAIGGWNLSVTTICLALLYGAWLPQAALRGAPLSRSFLRALAPALGYLAVVAVSALGAYRFKLSLYELFLLGQTFLLFVYVVRWVRTERDVLFVVTVLLAGAALEGLVMIGLRYGVGQTITIAHITARMEDGRVAGTIGAPNPAASYFTVLLPVALGALLTKWPLGCRAVALLALGFGAVALVLTLSRGGWISCGAAILLVCLAAWIRGRLPPVVPAVIGVCALGILLGFSGAIASRFTNYDRGSAYSRIPLMNLSLRMVRDNPLFGAGTNNFTVAMERYAGTGAYRGGFNYVVHNRYLQIMAETGVAGLLAFLFFMAVALHQGWRSWKHDHENLSPIALGITMGLVGEMIHMNVDTFNSRPQVQLLWLVIGLTMAISSMRWTANPVLGGARAC